MKIAEINDLTLEEQDAIVVLAKHGSYSQHRQLKDTAGETMNKLSRSIAKAGVVISTTGYKMLMHRSKPHKKAVTIYTLTNEGINLAVQIQKMRNGDFLSPGNLT